MSRRIPLPGPLAYARERLAFAEPRELPSLLARYVRSELRSRLWDRLEQRVYVFHASNVAALPNPKRFRRDCWEDLECYQRAGFHDQLPRHEFLKTAEERMRSGHHPYTCVEDGVLVHYGWLGDRQIEAPDSKIGLAFLPPPGSAVVWDNYSHPRARGRGLMKQFLYQTLHDAVEIAGATRIYGYVFSYNTPSARSCEGVGFTHAGSLVKEVRLGRIRRYAIPYEQPFETRPI